MTGIVSELSSPTIDSVYLSLGLLAVLSALESSQQDWESDVTVQMVKGWDGEEEYLVQKCM